MKIGYVLKRYPRLSETFIVNEILGLESHGVDVSIHALGFPEEPRFHPAIAEVAAGVTYLPAGSDRAAIARAFELLRRSSYAEAFPRIMTFLDRIDPRYRTGLVVSGLHLAQAAQRSSLDHVHAHFMTVAAHVAYIAHLVTDIPFSATAHAKDIFKNGVDREIFREVASAAEAVITVSDYNVEFLGEHLLHSSEARVVRVYNGMDVARRSTTVGHRQANLILAVGRLVEKKGFDLLLEAMVRLSEDVELVIVGDGQERGALERLSIELGVDHRVTFVGSQRSDVVQDWMSRARLLVAPFVIGTDGNQDALPTVLIEALAAGLPVVASAVGGVGEIIDDGETGIVVSPRDQPALIEGITRLLGDDCLHEAFAGAGRQIALDRFDTSLTTPLWLRAVAGDTLPAVST